MALQTIDHRKEFRSRRANERHLPSIVSPRHRMIFGLSETTAVREHGLESWYNVCLDVQPSSFVRSDTLLPTGEIMKAEVDDSQKKKSEYCNLKKQEMQRNEQRNIERDTI